MTTTLFIAIAKRENFKLRALNISSNVPGFLPGDTLLHFCLKLAKVNLLGSRLVDGHYKSLLQDIHDSQDLKLKTLIVDTCSMFPPAFNACLHKVNVLFKH